MREKVKSSGRTRRRYILFGGGEKKKIEKIILDYLGILGWAKASPVFVEDGKRIILSVARRSVNDVKASFEICEDKINIVKVSGTLKGLGAK
ncbi:hypothetical protein A2115_02065 [Candidatus Woesebacteria bacterium GWA1_41_8]|uniref:Uncharacterized protein n=1 Tax=Candidatus Woesebacteria bacterium GWA1_41_8 TaxID=1802471 RepID=A0A1F7WH37_9BACT|nr:MAG: hypothetical protein A2115_02065 [Candidatus Woesebacteria bacterium GWA1_41_8]